jgi:two-component system nitrate/nitrite sensor histidine kinase NarX
MNDSAQTFATQYTAALESYLDGEGEAALRRAYELGRRALEYESGVLVVAAAHHKALQAILLRKAGDETGARMINAAADFFSECLSPFEMARRGFQESIASLRDLNEALHRQQRDLRLLLSPMPDLLLTIDEQNRLAAFFAPPGFPSILKAREVGIPLADVLPDEFNHTILPALPEVRQSQQVYRMECPLTIDGQTLYFELQLSPVSDSREVLLVIDDITERKAIQMALYQQAQEVAALNERQRLARDLHDAVSQSLFSASIIAESLPRLWEQNPNKVLPNLVQLHRLIRSAAAEMRILLWELRPSNLVNTTMDILLTHLVNAVQARTKMTIECTVERTPVLPEDVHIAFYRIAQESLNNIVKHSQATEASIHLTVEGEQARLRIRDNGRGFRLEGASSGLGLGTMRERAQIIGASLELVSEPGQGTEITVTWAPGREPATRSATSAS